MFDIGFAELLVVFVVGLLILGPERLPTAAKTAGLWIRKIRRSIQSVQREINAQLDQEELQRSIKETNERIMRETAKFEQAAEAATQTSATSSTNTQADPSNEANSSGSTQDSATANDHPQSRT
ncbi:Sec-independent protein translocase protein TatB [Marinomonas ostreistagni]|uniref:Sec-independent protein translocase protein TatB n=1 Tax=Marinomonas ostreistagni TaxID=359209 RepID=UPI00194F10A7|nr:twin-arginine translocase subunit TatB [Marinomonas ostreistagni]